MLEKCYKVYMFIFPNGKRYVGMTLLELKDRAGKDGIKYKGQRYLYNAIKKYGWNNIEKRIIQEDLDKESAEKLERKMIKEYDLTNKFKGYNIELGGNHCGKVSENTRIKLSDLNSGEKHPQYGKPKSEETRRKISETLTGRKVGKRGPMTEEQKKKISNTLKGRSQSEETLKKQRDYYKTHKIHNYGKSKFMFVDLNTGQEFTSPMELATYLSIKLDKKYENILSSIYTRLIKGKYFYGLKYEVRYK